MGTSDQKIAEEFAERAKDDPVSFDLFPITRQGHICEFFFLPQFSECLKDGFGTSEYELVSFY